MRIHWRSYLNHYTFQAQLLAFFDYLIATGAWAEPPITVTVRKTYATAQWPNGKRVELRFDEYPNVWAKAQAGKVRAL